MRLFQAIRPLCSAGFGSALSPERTNEQNTMNIHDILAKVRQQSVTERQKGAVFEKLMQRWLQSDPRYCNLLKKVWLWDEFPAKGEFGGKDTGIDLVARTVDGDYWAVQCKCYAEGVYIDMATLGDAARRRRRDGMPCWIDAPIQQSRWVIGTT